MYVKRELRSVFLQVALTVLGLHYSASNSAAQYSFWSQAAEMPTARLGLATTVVDGKLYAIGGYPAANIAGLTTIEEYDPIANSWTTKTDMPTRRRWLSASAVNGKIYAIGGFETLGSPELPTVEEYDIATDSWVTKAPMPTPRKGLTTAVVDGKIYAIGGASPNGRLTTVEMYDPVTDAWSAKANMPTSTSSVSVLDGNIYAFGGILTNGTRSVQEYDPATDKWTKRANMPTARGGMTTSSVDGIFYAMGGLVGGPGGTVVSAVEKYDPVADQWTVTAGMPTARWGLASSVIDNQIYAIGGASGTGSHPGVATVERYDVGGALAGRLPVVLSTLGHAYTQDFDDALGTNGRRTGIMLPDGWLGRTEHIFEVVDGQFRTTPVLRDGNFFNAGLRSDPDRALATRVPSRGDGGELQFKATLQGSNATQMRLQFDLEAWGAKSLSSSATAGEAAFRLVAEADTGSGFEELLDLGTVTTGPTLLVPDDRLINGNEEAFRTQYDSGWLNNVAIPEDTPLLLRWITETTKETSGWTFGLDNVRLEVGILGDVNRDGALGVEDVDLVSREVWNPSGNLVFDLTSDGSVSRSDVDALLKLTNVSKGDANFDGEVEFSDFLILSDNFGQGDRKWSQGDFDSDGAVSFPDFLTLSHSFGQSASIAAAVPEPSGLLLAVLALVGIRFRRKAE